MLLQVFQDIQAFVLIMIIVMLGFTHANYICRLWPKTREKEQESYHPQEVLNLFSTVFLSEYQSAMGNFDLEYI